MFFYRERELRALQKRWDAGAFECVVIYGRRRVGKTALINTFRKGKPSIYFSALDASARENLVALSRAIFRLESPDRRASSVFSTFDDAMQEVTRLAEKERLLFVIDEYPYLAKSDPSVSSRLQALIDQVQEGESRLFLILCGSSMSFMQNQVLGYQSPLFGRRTAQFKIEPLDYNEMEAFCPGLSLEDQALLYGITGGVPHYINKLSPKTGIDEALIEHFFNASAYLFEEPGNLLKQELREPAVYASILSAVAGGASRLTEMAQKAGIEATSCTKYLKVLQDLGILKKETPVTEKPGKKTVYAIEAPFFRFWFRFVPKNHSVICAGEFEPLYERAVRAHFPAYMGAVFEKMCRSFLLHHLGELPVLLRDIGRWWGTDNESRKPVEIDLVGVPAEGDEYLMGSCKYKNEKMGVEELRRLQRSARAFGKGVAYRYALFSKSGFTEELIGVAAREKVLLFTLADLYARRNA